jgi:uncharacterized surface protein with fasciclin (FAS1) repeats
MVSWSLARRRVVLTVSAVLAGLVLVVPVGMANAADPDIVDTAVAAGQFTTLAKALEAAGLVDTLKGPGPFTVLAPTDAAFAKIPADQLNALLANKDALTKVLTYHVIRGQVPASEVVQMKTLTPIEGEPIMVSVSNDTVTLNNSAKVVQTDIMASNGVIHGIDTVLIPPSIANPPKPTPASPSSGSSSAGGSATVAQDGQSLSSQSATTQALFNATWGGNAPTRWVTEHNAAIGR